MYFFTLNYNTYMTYNSVVSVIATIIINQQLTNYTFHSTHSNQGHKLHANYITITQVHNFSWHFDNLLTAWNLKFIWFKLFLTLK